MSSERWNRLKAVFQGALAQPPEQRRAWLEQVCAGDRALLQEAETLLQSLDTAGDFLERPAQVDPADLSFSSLVLNPSSPPDPANSSGSARESLRLDTFPPGTVIGSYRIERDIGRGGMGVVYVAEDVRLGRRVAVKALPPDVAANAEARARLRREARAAATISHPAVATVYALEVIDDHLFIVSEYVEGETLRAWISRGPMPPGQVRGIAIQIASALGAAHDAGVVHRDLKPENVMLTAGGAVKVVDFGIAHVGGPEATKLTRAGAMLGTPAYMAPEQLLGAPVDGRADIYAFGVLLNELVTGRHPLNMAPAAVTKGNATPSSLPSSFGIVIARCIQPDAAARYASARELLAALEAMEMGPAEAGLHGNASPYVEAAFRRPGADRRPDTSGRMQTPATSTGSPRWWWEFHQAVAALVYWVMLIPAWRARELLDSPWGRVFFVVVLMSVIVAANLRLNLWFTSRFYPQELRWARRRAGRWIRTADWVFVLTLATGGLVIGEGRSAIAVVLISVAIGTAVAFLVIERVTTRAAFRSATTPMH